METHGSYSSSPKPGNQALHNYVAVTPREVWEKAANVPNMPQRSRNTQPERESSLQGTQGTEEGMRAEVIVRADMAVTLVLLSCQCTRGAPVPLWQACTAECSVMLWWQVWRH